MKAVWIRLAADYGGVLNSGLCLLHCAASPLLLAWWGVHPHASEQWETGFLVVSGVLVLLATWRISSAGLRGALWGFFVVFAGAGLGEEQYPWLTLVQYVASAGLIGTHLLNMRYGRQACA